MKEPKKQLITPMKVLNEVQHYLIFRAGGVFFGINTNSVLSILELTKITPFNTDVPPYMKGVIKNQGKEITVIDFGQRLNLIPIKFTLNTCILLLDVPYENSTYQIGILVEMVQEVKRVYNNEIKETNTAQKYIKGRVSIDNLQINIFETKALFHAPEIEFFKQSVEFGY